MLGFSFAPLLTSAILSCKPKGHFGKNSMRNFPPGCFQPGDAENWCKALAQHFSANFFFFSFSLPQKLYPPPKRDGNFSLISPFFQKKNFLLILCTIITGTRNSKYSSYFPPQNTWLSLNRCPYWQSTSFPAELACGRRKNSLISSDGRRTERKKKKKTLRAEL